MLIMVTNFLQSSVANPYTFYEAMLRDHPIYWDDEGKFWATYSYKSCKTLLDNAAAQVPVLNQDNKDRLNQYAVEMLRGFTRLRNGAEHSLAREAAMLLFAQRKPVSIAGIVGPLLANSNQQKQIDWVELICKKLPVLVVLKSFGFNDNDLELIAGSIEKLVKIMLPVKTEAATVDINEVAKDVYLTAEKHLLSTSAFQTVIQTLAAKYPQAGAYNTSTDKIVALCVANLIGLAVIQAYDANRGLLSNSLLQILNKDNFSTGIAADAGLLRSMVIETLRFDPPVHNTRRIAVQDIVLDDAVIKKGESVFIVLAAANRDRQQFAHPNIFDAGRINNHEHLAFGAGGHACPASQFSVNLVTETLSYFFKRFRNIEILDKEIQYEPLVNVRLPKQILMAVD